MRALIERMDPGGVSGRAPSFTGQPHAVAFTSTLPAAAAGQITRLADIRLLLDGQHRLLLTWSPHLANLFHAAEAQQSFVLLDGVLAD